MANKYSLNKKRFIEWLINDHEDFRYFGNRFREDLLSKGKVNVSIKDLFKERDVVPSYILVEADEIEDDTDEIYIEDVKLIN